MIEKIINEINNNNLEEAINLIVNNEDTLKDLPEYWSVRGFVSCLVEQYDIAIKCFIESIKLGSTDADMYYNLSLCYEKIGLMDLAILNSVIAIKYNIADELKNEILSKYEFSELFKRLTLLHINDTCGLAYLNTNTCVDGDSIYNKTNFNILSYIEALDSNKLDEFKLNVTNDVNIDKCIKEEILNNVSVDNNVVKVLMYAAGFIYSRALDLTNSIEDANKRSYYVALINYMSNSISSTDTIAAAIKYSSSCNTKIHSFNEFLNECSAAGYCVIDLSNSLYESPEMLLVLLNKKIGDVKYICSGKSSDIKGLKHIQLDILKQSPYLKPLVIWDEINYVPQIRALAEYGVETCYVVVLRTNGYEIVPVDKKLMNHVAAKKYLKTLSVCKRSSADGNVEAVIRNIPDEMKHYNIHMVNYNEVTSIPSIVLTPLISSVTLDGFGRFSSHPKNPFVKSIDVWHGGMGVKAIGLLDKNEGSPYYWADVFKDTETICLPSEMSRALYCSLFALPQSKFTVTGIARNDLLLTSDGRGNLEKIFGDQVKGKKIIFNLPTFHINCDNGRVDGDTNLLGNFKLTDFDFEKFNKFLEDNNMVCISKPHHAEEDVVLSNTTSKKYSNILFINDKDLDDNALNLYDVLNGADMLITDYSSVAGDFIFMNKPIVYLVEDLELYRESKGFSLEPFDFWSPGSKVKTQSELQDAICDNLETPELFEAERKTVFPLFFNSSEFGVSYNVWAVIDKAFKESR